MSLIKDIRQTDVSELIHQQRKHAVNLLLFGIVILRLVGFPLSISRVPVTGWQPAHLVHFVGLLVGLCLFLFRNRLRTETKAWFILVVTAAVAVIGLTTYGLFGNGMIWSVSSLFLAMAFINKRTAYLIGTVITAAVVISCYEFVYNQKSFPVDADIYHASLSAWGVAVFGAAVFSVLFVSIISMQRSQTEKLLVVLEQKNKDISHMADHDDLTGLPVYRIFVRAVEHSLEQARRENRHIAVCFIDLDNFKQVNDTFGHDAGDYILKIVADEIKNAVRASDVVSRMGGDEFVLLINSAEIANLEELCGRLLESIAEPKVFKGQTMTISASIGVSQLTDEMETAEQLIKRADESMYSVKLKDKSNFRIS